MSGMQIADNQSLNGGNDRPSVVLGVVMSDLEAIDSDIQSFVDANVRCQTCLHSVDEDLFFCYCEHPEGSAMATGANVKHTFCECHFFRVTAKNLELERLMDRLVEIYSELYPLPET